MNLPPEHARNKAAAAIADDLRAHRINLRRRPKLKRL